MHLAVRRRRRQRTTRCSARTSGPTRSRCSTQDGKFMRKWGKTGSGDGELLRPAGLAVEKNGNVIVVDSGNNRLQVFTPDGKLVAKCGKAGNGRRRVQPALGHHARQGRQHLRRRLEEPPRPEAVAAGQVPDEDRQLRRVAASRTMPIAVTYLGPYVSQPAGNAELSQGRACSTIRPTSRSIRTATSTSPIGATTGSAIFDADGTPLTNLIRRCAGVVEMGPAERRCQPRHDEGVAPGEEPRSRCSGSASRRRWTSIRRPTRSSSPTASATGCRSTRRFATTGLPGEPVVVRRGRYSPPHWGGRWGGVPPVLGADPSP